MSFFENIYSGATFSVDRKYRYRLWRNWDSGSGKVMFIGLNPSKGDETKPDNTLTRCMIMARDWGYSGLFMMNLFSYMATKPVDMFDQIDPVGKECDKNLIEVADLASIIVCVWGNNGVFMQRDKKVLSLLSGKKLHCLRLTKSGNPEHPLYLPKTIKPIVYEV